MNQEQLQEHSQELDIDPADLKDFRLQRFKEKWLYPVSGAFTVAASAAYGYFRGLSEGEGKPAKLVNRDTGNTYPYSGGHQTGFWDHTDIYLPFTGVVALGGLVAGILTYRSKLERKKLKFAIILITVLLSVILFVHVFWQSFEGVEQPANYYSGAIDYGVYSREIKP